MTMPTIPKPGRTIITDKRPSWRRVKPLTGVRIVIVLGMLATIGAREATVHGWPVWPWQHLQRGD